MKKYSVFILAFIAILIFSAEDAHAESQSFFVDPSYHWQGRTSVSALLRTTGTYAYLYIEDVYWNTLTQSEQMRLNASVILLRDEFDTVIYPKLTDFFGGEWNPGIDNDPRITILFIRMPETTGGYFNTNDEASRIDFPTSNEREIIYINALFIENPKAKAFIAHEFQHLTTFYQKNKLRGVSEDIWLNEARSEYAATYLGYDTPYSSSNLQNRVSAFLNGPSDSLTEWQNQPKDYAQVNLFFQYLIGRYGDALVREMMRSDSVGIASINAALGKIGAKENFKELFTDWTVTNLVNNCTVLTPGLYCYQNPDLGYGNIHVTFDFAYSASTAVSQESYAKDWEAAWSEYTPGLPITNTVLELDFSTSALGTSFTVPYVITKANGEKFLNFVALTKTSAIPYERGKAYITGFGMDVSSVVVIPSHQGKVEGFSAQDPRYAYTLRATLVESAPLPVLEETPQSSLYPDGSLLRLRGGTKVYVIQGVYKRWIRSPEIFNMYGHLGWEDIIEVEPSVLDGYSESNLVRAYNDTKVYEIDSSSVKHWLRMSADSFTLSGRKWEATFIINEKERGYYGTGTDLTI